MLFQKDFFDARYLWVLDLASEEDLHPLNLGELLPVRKEQFHIIIVLVLEEVLETVLDAELLALVRQQSDINYGKHVLSPLYLQRTPVDYDEVLLGHRS